MLYPVFGHAQAAPQPAASPVKGAPTLAVQGLVAAAKEYADETEPGLTREEKLRRTAAGGRLDAILDLHEMAHRILIKQWDKLKPAQREKYAGLLAALVRKIGYPQMEKYFNGKIEIAYDGEKPLDGGTAVLTRMIYKEEDLTLATEFHLHSTASGWRVYDVLSDGESLLLIYRNQHMGIIRDKGFPELIRLMEKKLHEAK